jgi:2-phosphosulfolactate phosphatase
VSKHTFPSLEPPASFAESPPSFRRVTHDDCSSASGAVVVIDVLRAFTTAAFAFAAGARELVPVETVEQAFALRARLPGALLMGEVDGDPIAGFDLGNSPGALLQRDLRGRRLIQRTSAGTRGLVASTRADALFAASLVCAGATARALGQHRSVTFVVTGAYRGRDGDEDAACADYLEAMLCQRPIDTAELVRRVRSSQAAESLHPDRDALAALDLALCVDVDRFDFALRVERRAGLLVMRATPAPRERVSG